MLFVLIVAIVVVVAVRRQGGGATPSSAAGPVDICLIGRWRQTDYRADVDVGTPAKGAPIGVITLRGSGREWRIKEDGAAEEIFDLARYAGNAADARAVELSFKGVITWKVKTAERKMIFSDPAGSVEMTLTVSGVQDSVSTVNPHNNPQPYTCAGAFLRTTSLTDPNAFSQYVRVP